MKAGIHPKWYKEAVVKCACGNTFTVGSTVESLEVDVCSNCHPFYTGQMKYVDTKGRVDAFQTRRANAQDSVLSKADRRKIKRQKKMEAELDRPDTLEELRRELVSASGGKKSSKKKAN